MRQAKQQHRRLQRQYRRTSLQSDSQEAFLSARSTARADVQHAIQVVTTRCPTDLVTEIVGSHVCASHCQTHQPVTADWKVFCRIQESAGASTAEEGRARQFTVSELQADLQPADHVQGPGETRVGTAAAPPAQLCQLSQFQSAYRKGHSMETTLLEVLDGVFMVADDKQVTVMIGLHLSAAFDTIDHRLLLDRLLLEFGVMEILLRWLQSYLSSSRWAARITRH